jgi:hypothetical protein
MPLLSSGDYPAVRAAIDVSLDELSLPDSIVGLDIYAGTAERYIASRTTGTAEAAKAAAIYYLAALLAPSIPNITSERDEMGLRYERKPVDWAERSSQLQARAEEQIDLANEVTTLSGDRPTMFAVARGRRGL